MHVHCTTCPWGSSNRLLRAQKQVECEAYRDEAQERAAAQATGAMARTPTAVCWAGGGGSRAPSGSPWARTSYSVCIGGCRRAPLRPPGYTLPGPVHLTRVAFALAAEGRSVLYGVLAGMLPALALVVRAGRNQGWHKTSQTRLGGGGIMLCLQLQCSQPHCPLARAYTTRSTCSRHRWQWGFGGDCHPGN